MSAQLSIRIEGVGGPSEWGDQDTMGTLYDENNIAIYSHYSSSVTWLIRDLTSRSAELATKYPQGWEAFLEGECVASWHPRVDSDAS